MRRMQTRELVLAALVAALYTVLSYFGSVFGLSYGPVQCRFAEALCVLPFFFPATAPGLFVGCLLANLLSPVGLLDLGLGSVATLLAALWTARVPCRWMAPLPPVLLNAVALGFLFSWYEAGTGAGFWTLFAANGVAVAIGEAVACCALGGLLLVLLPKHAYFRGLMPPDRLNKLGSKETRV